MYRTPGRAPDPEPEPQVPAFYVVWPAKEAERRDYTSHTTQYNCIVKYAKFDTLEEAQKHVEARHRQDPKAQVFMFYGHMAIPSVNVQRQVIEHVSTEYKVV